MNTAIPPPNYLPAPEQTKFFVADDVHPQNIDLLKTRAVPLGVEVKLAQTPTRTLVVTVTDCGDCL